MQDNSSSTGVIILAAGASTRLGEPKQELIFEGKTLLQRATEAALASVCSPVIVVLGAKPDVKLGEVSKNSVLTIENRQWEEGMASSIRCGLSKLLSVNPDVASCIFMVCDQPFVNKDLLNAMVHARNESGKKIVACVYQDTMGTPVLFDKGYFPELLALNGQEGAKRIVHKYEHDVASISFPLGAIDIDTAKDYFSLIRTAPDAINPFLSISLNINK